MRGPGEKELETDRRIANDRIAFLKDKLDNIDKQSSTQRKHRDREGAEPHAGGHPICDAHIAGYLAFIAGVVPLLTAAGAGSEVRKAMGVTVFAGMLGVTLFGLLLTPIFYVAIRKLAGGHEAVTPEPTQPEAAVALKDATVAAPVLQWLAQNHNEDRTLNALAAQLKGGQR